MSTPWTDPLAAAPRRPSRWRPGPSALAFVCTLVLLGAFTRVGCLEPVSASDAVLAEFRVLVPVLMLAIALAHALVAAAAARLPRVHYALAVLVAATAALPLVVDGLRAPIQSLLMHVAPRYCSEYSWSCPQDAWTPAIGALVGAMLAPIVAAAVHSRRRPAADAPARMLSLTGIWTGAVAVALRVAHLAEPAPLALASTVALGCALAGFVDTAARSRRIRALLAAGRLIVRAPRADEAAGLLAYVSVGRSTPCDGVLCLDEVREASPYRAVRHGRCLALAPTDVAVMRRTLVRRLFGQGVALVALVAALAQVAAEG